MDDVIGSPYAITNYTVNPEIGTAGDLAAVRSALNGMGIRVRWAPHLNFLLFGVLVARGV